MMLKISGIICIILVCIGFMFGVGVSFCVVYIIVMLIIGRMKYGLCVVRFWI